MLIAINHSMRRARLRRVAALLVMVIALAVAHGAVGAGHMSASTGNTMDPVGHLMSMGTGGGAAAIQDTSAPSLMTMCLAIVETAALVAGALALALALAAHVTFALLWPSRGLVLLRGPREALERRGRPPDLVALQVCVQ